MAFKYAPRVKELVTTVGIGKYTLGVAAPGYSTFENGGIYSDDNTLYCCASNDRWEIGEGHLELSPGFMQPMLMDRVTLHASSTNSFIDWPAGTKELMCIFPYNMLKVLQGGAGSGAATFNSFSEYTNDVKGSKTLALGSYNIIDSATDTVIIVGDNNTVVSPVANSYGFGNRMRIGKSNVLVFASNNLLDNGDMQQGLQHAGAESTGAVEEIIYALFTPIWGNANTTIAYTIDIVGRHVSNVDNTGVATPGDSKWIRMEFLVRFYNAGADKALVGTMTKTVIASAASSTTWDSRLDLTQTFPLLVTGEANKKIRWMVTINSRELTVV